MDKQQMLSRLKERLKIEKAAYEAAGLPDYVRLNKTRFNGSMQKQGLISNRIAAIQTAISVLENPFYMVDVSQGILMGISDKRADKDDLYQLASSSSLSDRRVACQVLFDTSLPLFKKEILKYST